MEAKSDSRLVVTKEAKALTLVYVSTKEQAFEILAGSEGLEGLIVRFPNLVTKSAVNAKGAHPATKSWHCTLCALVYDEAAGLPEEGIASGTRWEECRNNGLA